MRLLELAYGKIVPASGYIENRRREFIVSAGCVASILAAGGIRAQQSRIFRIGALLIGNADLESFKTELRVGLREAGLVEGKNIQIEIRSAEGKTELLTSLAEELVKLPVDVIVAVYVPAALAAQKATQTIPIVVVGDLLGSGLITSLPRPGGNTTGISLLAAESHGKLVELFRDMLPSLRRVAFLANGADPFSRPLLEKVTAAAETLGVELAPVITVQNRDEIEAAFASMAEKKADALVFQGSLATQRVAELAIKHRLPSATLPRSFVNVGGLMSYGANGPETFRRSAYFVTKILQGAKPQDIPTEQPTQFDLVVNLKTAEALGLKISEAFLLRANEIVE